MARLIKVVSDESLPRRASLLRNFAWMVKGNLIYAACQWLITVGIARLSSPERLGDYALASGIAIPVFLLFNLQLRAVEATDSRNLYQFSEYRRLRGMTTLCGIILICCIALFRGRADIGAAAIVLLGLSKAADALADIHQGLFQKHERMDWISRSMALRGTLGAGAFLVVMYVTASLPLAVATLALASSAVLFSHDMPRAAEIARSRERTGVAGATAHTMGFEILGQLARRALPLGIVMGLVSVNVQLPRYFISAIAGEYELGLFAASAYILTGINTVVEALGQSCSPRLSQLYATGDISGFRRLLLRQIGIVGGLGLAAFAAAAVAGRPILTIVYGAEYAQRSELLVWIMAATPTLFTAVMLGYAMTAAQYFRAQLPVFVLATLTTAAGCAVLLPRYGAVGAGMALLASTSVQWVGSAAVVIHACATRVKPDAQTSLVPDAI